MSEDLDRAIEKIQKEVMEDAQKIYSQRVIEHWLHPRNLGKMDNPDGYGKLTGRCGDTLQIFIKVRDQKIIDTCFIADGCGPSIAAGDVATELAKGKDIQEACHISQEVVLNALDGLPEKSAHCALLASLTLTESIKDYLSNKG